jgi:hypothetical protein
MEGFDGRVYFRLLAAVAAADGVIHEGERELFGELLERAGAESSWSGTLCDEAVEHKDDPFWFLPQHNIAPKETVAVYIRDALFVGMADGTLVHVERSLIQQATRLLGAPELCETVPALQEDSSDQSSPGSWPKQGHKNGNPSLDAALKVAGGAAIVAGTAAAGVFLGPAVMGLAAAAIGVNTLAAAGVTLLGAGVAGRALLDH